MACYALAYQLQPVGKEGVITTDTACGGCNSPIPINGSPSANSSEDSFVPVGYSVNGAYSTGYVVAYIMCIMGI